MTEVQPMKMAAAEALWDGKTDASFSLFTIGSLDGSTEVWSIRVPGVLSFMATETLHRRTSRASTTSRRRYEREVRVPATTGRTSRSPTGCSA